jgi:hypothetical protein
LGGCVMGNGAVTSELGAVESKNTCRLIEIYLVTRAIETAWPATVSNGSRTLLRTLA